MNSARIKKCVRRFKREYGLQHPSVKDLEKIFDRQGFTVVRYHPTVNDVDVQTVIDSFGLQELVARANGFLYMDRNYRLVFINEKLSDQEALLVLAHEEGHFYCGHASQIPIVGQSVMEEYEANEFAHYLLHNTMFEKAGAWIAGHKGRLLIAALLLVLLGTGIQTCKVYRERRVYEGEY